MLDALMAVPCTKYRWATRSSPVMMASAYTASSVPANERHAPLCRAVSHPRTLVGSIRDDGPMPSVINDMQEAQRKMRKEVQGVEMAIMIASMLHAIATGNLLPSTVRTVVVDINPAVVTKLADRGSFQAAGLVTDAEFVLRELAEVLS